MPWAVTLPQKNNVEGAVLALKEYPTGRKACSGRRRSGASVKRTEADRIQDENDRNIPCFPGCGDERLADKAIRKKKRLFDLRARSIWLKTGSCDAVVSAGTRCGGCGSVIEARTLNGMRAQRGMFASQPKRGWSFVRPGAKHRFVAQNFAAIWNHGAPFCRASCSVSNADAGLLSIGEGRRQSVTTRPKRSLNPQICQWISAAMRRP